MVPILLPSGCGPTGSLFFGLGMGPDNTSPWQGRWAPPADFRRWAEGLRPVDGAASTATLAALAALRPGDGAASTFSFPALAGSRASAHLLFPATASFWSRRLFSLFTASSSSVVAAVLLCCWVASLGAACCVSRRCSLLSLSAPLTGSQGLQSLPRSLLVFS